MMRALYILAIFFLSLSSLAWASPRMIVFPLRNNSRQQYSNMSSKVVTHRIITAFSNTDRIAVLEREHLPQILEANLGGGGDLEASLLQELQAEYLCFGRFDCNVDMIPKYIPSLGKYHVTCTAELAVHLRIVDAKTGKILAISDVSNSGGYKEWSRSASIPLSNKLCNYLLDRVVPQVVENLAQSVPYTSTLAPYSEKQVHGTKDPQYEEKTVVVEGVGLGTDYPIAREVALSNAFRMAIEKVAGVYLESQSQTKHFRLISDRIYTESRGLVSNYEVLDENQSVSYGGQKKVKVVVKCIVSPTAVRERWQTIRAKLKHDGYPRVLILLRTDLHELPVLLRSKFSEDTLKIGIEGIFREAGFKLLDPQIAAHVRERDIAVAAQEDNINLTKALGAKYRGDLGLFFDFRATLKKGQLLGSDVEKNTIVTLIHGRIVKLDTGEYVSSINKNYSYHAIRDTNQSVHLGLDNAGKKFAKDMIHAILDQSWDIQQSEGDNVEITISRIRYDQVRKFKKILAETQAIKNINQRAYSNEVWSFEVMTALTTDKILDLIYDLGERNGLNFEVKSSTKNKITLEVSAAQDW